MKRDRPSRAAEHDAERIASLHIASWRATYTRELSQAVLQRQDVAAHTAAWRRRLAEGVEVFLAEGGGELAGFVACGPARGGSSEEWEIYNLHVAPTRHGQGLGSLLFDAALELGRERGARELVLWVVRTNDPARRFYERKGMRSDGGEQERAMGDETLHEVRYKMDLEPAMTGPTLVEIEEILSRTPRTLRAVLEDLPEPWLVADEGEGTFSPRDVLGHLIHGEKTDWVPRIKLILASGETQAFVPFDRFAFRDAIRGASTAALLADFEALRASNLVFLRSLSLTRDHLALRGKHPELGAVTLGQLLVTWAVHDLDHIAQVVRVMAKRCSEAVGPWKAYLGILKR